MGTDGSWNGGNHEQPAARQTAAAKQTVGDRIETPMVFDLARIDRLRIPHRESVLVSGKERHSPYLSAKSARIVESDRSLGAAAGACCPRTTM
jgi:hypothetical protein